MPLNLILSENKRDVAILSKEANKVLALTSQMKQLTDEELYAKTDEFRNRYKEGESLDKMLPEAFAVCREAVYRTLGLSLFKTQIMAGIALYRGNVAEQKTGEGKTLTVTMPTYLESIAGKGVHVVTVNEYLAMRDSGQTREIFSKINTTVGTNYRSLSADEKREVYACDVTYTTNAELGFDYLRDNMVMDVKDRVLRGLHVAFVDEADSILIDESRTPLIISGGKKETANLYVLADKFVKTLVKPEYKIDKSTGEKEIISGDYDIDDSTRQITLTASGIKKAEHDFKLPNLYATEHSQLVHHINQALKANYVMTKGVEYIVSGEEVILVDQFTGRTMPGRSYSDGLQQALQAKEDVPIEEETSTLATITYQNFFRLYDKLAGMTGTAKTEEEEFLSTYNMKVICIPTNKPIARKDLPDRIYIHKASKYKALIQEVKRLHVKGQPVLIGTISVDTSELLHEMLVAEGIPHEVLNAKNHAKEADIIAKAGRPFAVTIATNMAGRGTDIKLTPESRNLGGLVVLGSERHESRRIDNQLRGRSGRQGDPGRSEFFVSLEDDLVTRYGGEKMMKLLTKYAEDDETPMTSKTFSRSMTSVQKRAEGMNFDSRKNLLDYDDVLRRQREIIYKRRNELLEKDDVHEDVYICFRDTAKTVLENAPQDGKLEDKLRAVCRKLNDLGMKEDNLFTVEELKKVRIKDLPEYITAKMWHAYEKEIEPVRAAFAGFEKTVVLRNLDRRWITHIDMMSKLRNGIHLRSYAQNNPLQQYIEEGFDMFNEMNKNIDCDITNYLLRIRITRSNQA